MNAAVVICLDRNKLIEQESGPPVSYFYEVEAVNCVRAWRENAKWQDRICAVQYEEREVSDKTAAALEQAGVEIFTMRLPHIKKPFMEVVYALRAAEIGEICQADRILYSDLDVVMQKPVPAEFLKCGRTVLYHYPMVSAKPERDSLEFVYRMNRCRSLGIFCHNTYFQAFDKGGSIQQTVFDLASSTEYKTFFENNVYYRPTDDDYFFEEGLYDYICFTRGQKFNIMDIECPSDFFDHIHAHMHLLKHGKTAL